MMKPDTLWLMLDGFIGQEDRLKAVEAAILSSKRGRRFPHTLLLGRAGTGKTTLAKLIGKELNIPVITVHASSVDDRADFTKRILDADGGILFIDEIHALDKKMSESLYTVLDSGTLVANHQLPIYGIQFRAIYDKSLLTNPEIWDGPGNYPVQEIVGYSSNLEEHTVEVTVIGATTDEALLPNPLLSRLGGLKVHLRTYSREELVDLINVRSLELCVTIDQEAAEFLAKRTRGNPRRIKQLIDRVIDQDDDNNLDIVDAQIALDNLGVDESGLEESHREMLRILKEGPISRTNLGYKLGIPAKNVDHYFGELMELGLAAIGRKHEITSLGEVMIEDYDR